jgi:hypothetical protein
MSARRFLIHKECHIAWPSAMYSAWQVELATVTRCWDNHMMGQLYSCMSTPYVDQELGPPQLASTKNSTGTVPLVLGLMLSVLSFVVAR